MPTAVDDGGGVNFGGTVERVWILIKTEKRNYCDGKLTQNLKLDGLVEASLKRLVGALTSDLNSIHVLRNVEPDLGRRDLSAPKPRLVRDAAVAHQGNSVLVPTQPHRRIARARVAKETGFGADGQCFRFHTYF